MTKEINVHFKLSNGTTKSAKVQVGMTLMEAAINNGITGIDAECGGACSCATCHVYIDENWKQVTGSASPMEEDMLDFAFDVRLESRLSCQIPLSEEMDGLSVEIPAKQG